MIIIEIVLGIFAVLFFIVGCKREEDNVKFMVFLLSVLCLGFIGLMEAVKGIG